MLHLTGLAQTRHGFQLTLQLDSVTTLVSNDHEGHGGLRGGVYADCLGGALRSLPRTSCAARSWCAIQLPSAALHISVANPLPTHGDEVQARCMFICVAR